MPFSFRLDRAVSVGLIHPLSARRKKSIPGRVAILMYHGITPAVGRRHPYFETNTSPDAFRAQMNALAQGGYATLDLEGALSIIQSAGDGTRKVVITFDDGYRDFYDKAFPILIDQGFQATLFVVTGLTGAQRVSRNGKDYMTWGEVREVHSRGIRIGSHTVDHSKLWNMTSTQVCSELRDSKAAIEDKLGAPVESFAYPYAFPAQDKPFVQFLRDRLQEFGYTNGVSTTIGMAKAGSDRYFLPRLPINTFDDEAFFQAKLEGGYEWLRGLQQVKKRLLVSHQAAVAR
jgi:peptidoglycan/xylan/chitin deacetylase (PgdA/CDA1 family)